MSVPLMQDRVLRKEGLPSRNRPAADSQSAVSTRWQQFMDSIHQEADESMPRHDRIDKRHIETGYPIPSEGYCDQPYVVINADGSWTCTMTTGRGNEGDTGQHVVSLISADQGRTWEGPFDIEPADGPEASWVMPLRVPETGRIYAFYTYNQENQRQVQTVDGNMLTRVDSFGVYAYRFSDDGGRTWSAGRYQIPMRLFECDRRNVYGGKVMFFWGVGKPFVHRGKAYVCATKVGGFGTGFFVQNEGVLFCSPNLLTQPDPARHEWETLPAGEMGLRTPPAGGPIAGEFNATPMNDGSLYGTYRTIDGWSCHAYSRDDGRSWEADWMTYTPGGRRVKNPRSANFVRRFANGRYLYWFCFNGGERMGREPEVASWKGYAHRNPIWLCGGIEQDGRLHWSQPEIILYDDRIGNRMSYPDFIEDGDRIFITETQKTVARVHELDGDLLRHLWTQHEVAAVAGEGLVMDLDKDACASGSRASMPVLPELFDRSLDRVDTVIEAGADPTLPAVRAVQARGGFALEMWVRFDDLQPWQVLFDSRDAEGYGLLVQLTDRQTVKLHLTSRAYDPPGARWGSGAVESAWDCDYGLLRSGQRHQLLFSVDGGSRVITVMVDGVLCDGGRERQFGWARFHSNARDPNGAGHAVLAPSLHGELSRVRLYDRYLRTSEGVGNWRAESLSGDRPVQRAPEEG